MIKETVPFQPRSMMSRLRTLVNASGKSPLKYLRRLADFVADINLSIRAKILVSLCIVILIMGSINALLVAQVLSYSRQYDSIINNVTTANSITGTIKPGIDTEMWKIVYGINTFDEGKQYELISGVNDK